MKAQFNASSRDFDQYRLAEAAHAEIKNRGQS